MGPSRLKIHTSPMEHVFFISSTGDVWNSNGVAQFWSEIDDSHISHNASGMGGQYTGTFNSQF